MSSWDKWKAESAKAYGAFCEFCELPAQKRTYAEMARKGWHVTTVRRWSKKFVWQDRAAARDTDYLDRALSRRDTDRETYRQKLVDVTDDAIDVVLAVMMDPDATAATRLSAATQVLDRAGIVIPRRVELTGADGKELFRRASAAMDSLSDEQIAALSAAFPSEETRH